MSYDDHESHFRLQFCCGMFLAISIVLKLCFQSLPLAILISTTFFCVVLPQDLDWIATLLLPVHVLTHVWYYCSFCNMEFGFLESRCCIYENVPIWLADCHSFHIFQHFDCGDIVKALPIVLLCLVLLRSFLWNISLPGICNRT